MADEIVFTVNSPGEVSTWLSPTVEAVRRLDAGVRISVFVLPCLYASGTEAEVIRRMPGVDEVVPPREALRFILWGGAPGGWRPKGRGVVVFLGGEMLLAARLAKRLGYPAAAYTHGHVVSPAAFQRIFVPREAAKSRAVAKGAPLERIEVVGDLMVDAARVVRDPAQRRALAAPLKLEAGIPAVLILPGSRPYELSITFPLFAGAAARLRRELAVQFVVALSPYITADALSRALTSGGAGAELPAVSVAPGEAAAAIQALYGSPAGGAGARAEARAAISVGTVFGPVSLILWRGESRAVMAGADLALTIPGSNTAELAAWGVPMVVCLPLYRPEEIPLDGIAGYLDRLPLVGRALKTKAVLRAAERAKFVALPNEAAQEAIVPELRSQKLKPEEVAWEAKRLLTDPAGLTAMSSRLVDVMGPAGAAEKVARRALELLQS